ncbi:FGGY-family carbohydrate kinase [Stackebrandtia nassauensis]|uniref:Carbohydrate kinase FGGY n=1 Tax=Stackebrandtia nassauensis (strain DSM 44728 / CIP 108903 / NRRL B-16338 / NBRC 102104 / LLR-40K-21) TaxID=446470 RepID=D3Q0Y2_STANL|nr:FGGY family carbohydrate kinase [Stackebrandtia nassauensis]ADD43732.1 carbohydrate kinase FGGY [Stackebrandtia nassauensis DSM 44728]
MTASPRNGGRAWIGIDLGTQSARAVVVGENGSVLGQGSTPLDGTRWPDGRHEQNADDWWDAVATASRQAMAEVGSVEIAGLACCGTSGTVLLVEEVDGDPARPLGPGLMYDDSRAVEEAARVQELPAPVWAEAGLNPQRTWALPKALWLLRDGPPVGRVRLAHQVDVVNSRLIGRPAATDTSNALKSGIDPVAGAWPYEDLERLGLDPRLLPSLVSPGQVLGEVSAAASEATGIPVGVPVIAGMTDGCAAQIGAGVLRPGQWNIVVGTTIVLKGVSDSLLRDPTGALYSHRSPDGRWWPGGASSAGAGLLSQEFDPSGYDVLNARASEREPAGCVTYPLAGVGERFPFRRADARRLTLGEPRDDVDRYAAILQGVGFVERLCLDHLRSLGADVGDEVTLTGGATRSAYWTQLQADILGRQVSVPQLAEGAVGMAVLAASHALAEEAGDGAAGSHAAAVEAGSRALVAEAGDGAAASRALGLTEAAKRLLGPVTGYQPRTDARSRFDEPYAALVKELRERGWIGEDLATTALSGVNS